MAKELIHSKHKGNEAQSAVIYELQKHQIATFIELGDLSKVDVIAEKHGITKRIQVKYSGTEDDLAFLPLRKCGPNGYRYTYKETDVDWFALYHAKTQRIMWISSQDACKNKVEISIRMVPVNNHQKAKIRNADDYSIQKFLDDLGLDKSK